jgi:hypothetical protein
MATALVSAIPASAAAGQTVRPKLGTVSTSRSHLGGGGGTVRLHASISDSKRCRLSVRPALPKLPDSKPCTGSKIAWTAHLPANDSATAARYRFTLKAIGAHHVTATRHRTVHVAETTLPPTVSSVTTSKSALEFVGGNDTVTAHLSHARTCTLSSDPAITGLPATVPCTGAQKSWKIAVPQNTSTTATTYQLTVVAQGTHAQKATASTSISEAAHPPPCPGQTSTAKPTTTTYFNDPSTNVPSEQSAVVDAEINLICDAQLPHQGVPTNITMTVFIYELEPVTQALLWAHQYMHADVRLITDGSNNVMATPEGATVPNPAYEDLAAGLPAGSVILCGPNAGNAPPPNDNDDTPDFPAGTGCAGNNIMHTKMLTVSAVDGARDPVVFSTSQNLSENATTAAFNNAIQIVGDHALYAFNADYENQLASNTQRADFGSGFSPTSDTFHGATTTSAIFPQNSSGSFPASTAYDEGNDAATDTVAKLLNTVNCTAPGKNAGAPTPTGRQTVIRMAMFNYSKRPAVTAALTQLEAAGCDVQIIYSVMTAATMSSLQAAGINPTQLDDDEYPYTDGSGTGPVFVHDKYLLISGGLTALGHNVTNQDVVQTGSPNLTQKALHFNDEALISFQRTAGAQAPAVYASYVANWNHLASIAASIPPAAAAAASTPSS